MISIGIGALLFAIWYVTLFLEKSIGLSMVLFIAPFSYFFIYILEQNNKVKNKKAKFLLLPILLLSSTYLIYNNSFFNACNLVIIPTLLIFMILILIEGKINIDQKLFEKFLGFIVNPISNIEESVKKLNEKIKKPGINTKNEEKGKKIKKTAKALLVTFPVLIVVTVLLATADQVFGNIFRNIFEFLGEFFRPLDNIDTSMIFARIVFIVILFFYFIGLFYYYCMKYKVEDEVSLKVEKKNDNFTLKIILVSLNIIYLVFCYIQIKSLFLRNTTLNYADYARQGFFQLMVVSFINLATILIAKKRENKDEYKTNCFINCMSIIMIVFTFIIVISATLRMHFYESEYGYTLLRILVYCALFTESVLFIPTILFILDKKISLIKSYSIIIITIYICMNFMNFDNIIAKRNIDRYFETGKIDMYYLEYNTGTDAVNQILRILKDTKGSIDVKKETKRYLKNVYESLNDYEEHMDFRDFNISKLHAKKLMGGQWYRFFLSPFLGDKKNRYHCPQCFGGVMYSKFRNDNKPMKINLWIFFILYVMLFVNLTLFSGFYGRNGFTIVKWNKEILDNYLHNSLNVIPFKTILGYIFPLSNILSRVVIVNILGNLIACMPFGFFLPLLFKKQNNLRTFIITMVIIVLIIELLQFITLSGSCDIDDLILNVLGAVMMFEILNAKRVRKLIKRVFFV